MNCRSRTLGGLLGCPEPPPGVIGVYGLSPVGDVKMDCSLGSLTILTRQLDANGTLGRGFVYSDLETYLLHEKG